MRFRDLFNRTFLRFEIWYLPLSQNKNKFYVEQNIDELSNWLHCSPSTSFRQTESTQTLRWFLLSTSLTPVGSIIVTVMHQYGQNNTLVAFLKYPHDNHSVRYLSQSPWNKVTDIFKTIYISNILLLLSIPITLYLAYI